MVQNIPEKIFEALLEATAESLKPFGFIQRGPIFRLSGHGNCGLVEFQRSNSGNDEKLIFTVNLGVVCGELLNGGSSGAQKARIIDAHLKQRLGMLLTERLDKWWEVTESTDCASLAQEIVDLLLEKGVPYIESYLDTKALLDLWESGQSPGLTAVQRNRFVSKLKKE